MPRLPVRLVINAAGLVLAAGVLRGIVHAANGGGLADTLLFGASVVFAGAWMADFALSTWQAGHDRQDPGRRFRRLRLAIGGVAVGLATLSGLGAAQLIGQGSQAYADPASILFFAVFAGAAGGAWYAWIASPVAIGVARRYLCRD